MRSGTPSPRICCAMAGTCALCKSCSGMHRCRRRRNTPRSKARGCLRSMTPPIRARGRSDSRTTRMTIEPDVAAREVGGEKKDLPLGYAFAAAGALLFSTKGIIVKLAYGYDVSPETLIALRAAFSLPFFLAIGAFAWINLRLGGAVLPSARLIVKAMLVGVFGVWFASYTDFIGLSLIS